MNKQWSLYVRWGTEVTDGYVRFLWRDGKGGVQIDYTIDERIDAVYTVSFDGTDNFDGFVKWAFQCANSLPGCVFILAPGCPECGTILNADASECAGEWHSDKVNSVTQLETYMDQTFPEAVAQANGDQALAAMKLLKIAHSAVNTLWPMVLTHIQTAVTVLRQAGIK